MRLYMKTAKIPKTIFKGTQTEEFIKFALKTLVLGVLTLNRPNFIR